MKIQCTLEMTEEEFEKLWRTASSRVYSFKRVNPQKAWSVTEKKEVIRHFLFQLAESAVVRHDDETRT